MKNVIIVLTLVMTLTGCDVSRVKDSNYNPVTRGVSRDVRSADFYDCYKQASGQQSSNVKGTQVNVYHGDSSKQKLNKKMLKICMEAKGYRLRGRTNNEGIVTILTLPLGMAVGLLSGENDFY